MASKQTVLVTGGCGFIGTNLVRFLVGSGQYHVVNLDALTYAANPLSLADLEGNPNYVFVKGNITDRALVASLFETYQPMGVFHLAAESHVDRSIVSADDFVQTNVVGTYSLLEAARMYWNSLSGDLKKIFRFLHVSTDEVFGSLSEEGYFSETTPYAPNSPYSASKAASDHFVRAYHHTYGLPSLITNCSNNYGPYQFPEKMIPLMILNALSCKPLPVYGEGLNIRDWIYVEDHCKGIRLAFEKGKPGETYAIGGGNEHRNTDLVTQICSILDEIAPPDEVPQFREKGMKSYSELIHFVQDRPGHDHRYAIDSGKITRQLGWQAEVGFAAGLRRTIEWYLSNPEWVEQASSGSYSAWIEKNYASRGARAEGEKMKGIVLAGGKGTRLYPLTIATSKQLLPVYDKPMVYYPLSMLMLAGIREILVISATEVLSAYQELLKDGSQWGLHFEYAGQAKPRGLADAFLVGSEFIGNESVSLILGDNILYGEGMTTLLQECASLKEGALIFGYKVNDPERYGVVEFDDQYQVVSIEEKPSQPRSSYAIPGIYFYDNQVVEIAHALKPSARGELEITDLNRVYLERGQLNAKVFGRGIAWLDAGTHESLLQAGSFIQTIQERQGLMISCPEEIAYRMGYISKEQLCELGKKLAGNSYGEYILGIAEETLASDIR